MSLTITQRPNQSGSWVCAKNPIIYKMTRKDYPWNTLVTSAGNTSFVISTGGDQTAFFVAGDTIWLQSNDGAYSAIGLVVSSAFAGSTTVVTNVPYVANNAAGYINTITKRANYYVGVGIYKSFVNSLVGTVNYYPTRVGLLTIDVSSILMSVLDPSLPAGAVVEGTVNDSTASLEVYIKYTEFWTGSAEAIVTDVGNPFWGVIAANQIGQSGYLTTNAPLTKLDELKIMAGQFYALSFANSTGFGDVYYKKSWYKPDGTLYAIAYAKNNASGTFVVFTYFQSLSNNFTQYLSYFDSLYAFLNINNGGTIAWTLSGTGSGSVNVTAGNSSKTASALCFIASGTTVFIRTGFTISGTAPYTANLIWLDSTGAQIGSTTIAFTLGSFDLITVITPASDVYYIGLNILNATSGVAGTLSFIKLVVPNTYKRLDFQPVSVPNSLPFAETALVNNPISSSISCASPNTITLFWRNSAGGESSWSFGYVQDQVQKLQDPFRNVWLTLYEQNLTLSQFNALNELITLGQIYQTPLIELTTAVDKTEARVGQQVYTVDSSGNKIGVIVVAGENKTRSRNKRHQFQVTIELPEIFG